MPYPTVDEVKGAVAAALKLGSAAELQDYWTLHCQDGLRSAINDVRAAFFARGFGDQQIQSDVYVHDWVKDQARYWALVYGSALDAFDLKAVKEMDRRKELVTMRLIGADGLATSPLGVIGHGKRNDKDTVFVDQDGKWRGW